MALRAVKPSHELGPLDTMWAKGLGVCVCISLSSEAVDYLEAPGLREEHVLGEKRCGELGVLELKRLREKIDRRNFTKTNMSRTAVIYGTEVCLRG